MIVPRPIKSVLLIICDAAWMRVQIVGGWRMTGADVAVESFGSTMGRGWDKAGRQEHRNRNARWRRVASDLALQKGLDVVFLVALDDVLENETLIHFRKLGAKVVLYHADMLTQWYKVIRTVKYIDLLCYASADHLTYFHGRNIPLFDFGFAAVPPSASEMTRPPVTYRGVLYVGSPWSYRQRILQQLAQAAVPLRIYGHNWNRQGTWPRTPGQWRKTAHDLRWYLVPRWREEGAQLSKALFYKALPAKKAVQADVFSSGILQGEYGDEEFIPLVRGAAINLGFTQMSLDETKEHPRQIRLRDFEIPIAGGFYLAQMCPELAKYYEIGREIAVWDTAADVVERCQYYLDRPEERELIGAAGRARALRNHTWIHRLTGVATALGMHLPIQGPASGF